MRLGKKTGKPKHRREERSGVVGKGFVAMCVPRILVIVCMLVCAVLSCVFVNNAIGYLPLVIVVLGVLACFVYSRVVGNRLDIDDKSVPRDCLRGESIDFELSFINRSIMPIARLQTSFALTSITGIVDSTMNTDLAIAPRERLNYGFGVDFEHIGEYQVKLEWVRVYDPFGLFWRTLVLDNSYDISVTPHIFPIEKFEEFSVNEAASEATFKPIVTDDMDYAGVRDYEPGDPLKSIHWKLSARSDHYFTRLFEAFGVPGVSVYLDFSAPEYSTEQLMCVFDAVVESAFSIWEYARSGGMDSEFLFCDRNDITVKRKVLPSDEMLDVVKRMPNLSPSIPQRKAVELMRSVAGMQHSSDNVVFCTGSVSQELVFTLIELRSSKKLPILVVAVPADINRDARSSMDKLISRLSAASIPVFVIAQADEIGHEGR